MPILMNYFDNIPNGIDLRDDQQYNLFLEMNQLRKRQTEIEKEKLSCCGVELVKDEPRLSIVDRPRFKALVSEIAEAERTCTKIYLELNKFDGIAQEALNLGVEIPTFYGIERKAVQVGNQLVTRQAVLRSRIEELLATRPGVTAIEALTHPSIASIEIGNAELKERYQALLNLVERARGLK